MKRITTFAVVAACAVHTLSAEPVKALLVVQNHTAITNVAVLTAAGDLFASALGDERFEIINPNDVIGENQNVGPWGERMPTSSAVRLAESCGADILLTAAADDFSRRNFGSPPIAAALTMTWTIAAKRVPGGGTICSVTVPFTGKRHAVAIMAENASSLGDEIVRDSTRSAATAFLAKAAGKNFLPRKSEFVSVAFVANVAGADVKIDGVSRGIASTDLSKPFSVEVSKGLHNLEISSPFMLPYKTTVRFDTASTFAVNLHESPIGRAMRMEDKMFEAAVGRIVNGGATDDDVKLIKARGYAKCLEASSFKIEGMPERLTMVKGDVGAFGLGIIQKED
ncbi:MAG: hypothetical protein ACI4R9_04085 [Kiritimatiellia bacterium]